MDDITREFLIESREGLDQLDIDLVELEKVPDDATVLGRVFRTIHSIKGTCGFLGFEKLERLAHVGETLLGRLRDHELALDAEMTSALLAMADSVREILEFVEEDNSEGDGDYTALCETLDRLQRGESVSSESVLEAAATQVEAAVEAAVEAEVEAAIADPDTPAEAGTEPTAEAEPAPAQSSQSSQSSSSSRSSGPAEATVRVDVGLLDAMMNQVGELVLARNQILQFAETNADSVFVATTQRLNLITTELQQGVMKTRMQPIGTTWNKFPRIVRDLSTALGKKVRIEMEGEETELDRTISEAIKDPLTHIVRNSIDHGLETPSERLEAGKSEEGYIRLRAFHESGQVNIEIIDNGRGIDCDKVRDKAIRSNVITAQQAAQMSDREAVNLIFEPGLSTAQAVTNISGRGVGMDVVKTNIEKIGGAVEIQSEAGVGTTLRIKIPLTLAIIPGLIITSGGDSYAIPQVCLLELVRIEAENANTAIEHIHNVPVHRLRGKLLPIVWLNQLLGVEAERELCDVEEQVEAESALNIAVLQAGGRTFGLVVDDINDNQEIVVKPLGKLLAGLTCYAGATILGDGRVSLILDATGIAGMAGVINDHVDSICDNKDNSRSELGDVQTILVFAAGEASRMAIQLSQVSRLEEFKIADVEQAGRQSVVQYRDSLLPLVRLSDVLGDGMGAPQDRESVHAIVYSIDEVSVGLVVDEILDIVEARIQLDERITRPGVRGTAIVQGHTTEIVDIERVLELAGHPVPASHPEYLEV